MFTTILSSYSAAFGLYASKKSLKKTCLKAGLNMKSGRGQPGAMPPVEMPLKNYIYR